MKKTILVVVAVFIMLSISACSQQTNDAGKVETDTDTETVMEMKVERWEYNIISCRQLGARNSSLDMAPAMNRLGAEGWELVGSFEADTYYMFFKRRLP